MPYIIPDKKYYKEALKVKGKFDNGDDSWLKMDGNNNWAIAFHGLRTDVRNIVSLIAINGLKVGQNQIYENVNDSSPNAAVLG